jgi:hypothetical protein
MRLEDFRLAQILIIRTEESAPDFLAKMGVEVNLVQNYQLLVKRPLGKLHQLLSQLIKLNLL